MHYLLGGTTPQVYIDGDPHAERQDFVPRTARLLYKPHVPQLQGTHSLTLAGLQGRQQQAFAVAFGGDRPEKMDDFGDPSLCHF